MRIFFVLITLQVLSVVRGQWWPDDAARGTDGDVEEGVPQDTILSGALTDLISKEEHNEENLRNVQQAQTQLNDEDKELKLQLKRSKQEEIRYRKMAQLSDNAQQAARSIYERKLRSVVQDYDDKAKVTWHRLESCHHLRALANKSATRARHQLVIERRQRQRYVTYAKHLKHKLNATATDLKLVTALYNRERAVESLVFSKLNSSQRQLQDANKVGASLTVELAEAQALVANRSDELDRAKDILRSDVQHWQHDAHALRDAWQSEHVGRTSAEHNASSIAAGALAAATSSAAAFQHKNGELQAAHTDLEQAKQERESVRRELNLMKKELIALKAHISSARQNFQQRIDDEHLVERKRVEEYREVEQEQMQKINNLDDELKSKDDILNFTAKQLSAAKIVVGQLQQGHARLLKASSELHERENEEKVKLSATIAENEMNLKYVRDKLKIDEQDVNSTRKSLATALQLLREEKDGHEIADKMINNLKENFNDSIKSYKNKLFAANFEEKQLLQALKEKNAEFEQLHEKMNDVDQEMAATMKNAEQMRDGMAKLLIERDNAKKEQVSVVGNFVAARAENHDLMEANENLKKQIQQRDGVLQKQKDDISENEAELRQERSAAAIAQARTEDEKKSVEQKLGQALSEVREANEKSQRFDDKLQQIIHEKTVLEASNDRELKQSKLAADSQTNEIIQQQNEISTLTMQLQRISIFRDSIARQLADAKQQVQNLNATHVELAAELGVTVEQFRIAAGKEVREFKEMHHRLYLADDELKANRKLLGEKEEKINEIEKQLQATVDNANSTQQVKNRLQVAEDQLQKFSHLLSKKDGELQAVTSKLVKVNERWNELARLKQQLNETSDQLNELKNQLSKKGTELEEAQRELHNASTSKNQIDGEKDQISTKLNSAFKQLNLSRAELVAEDGELNITRKELMATMVAVKDLHEMRAKLNVAEKELQAYHAAMTARTSELNATRNELSAAKGLRKATVTATSAEVKEVEEMKTRLRLERSQLVTLKVKLETEHSALTKKESAFARTTQQLGSEANALRLTQQELAIENSQFSLLNVSKSNLSAALFLEKKKTRLLDSEVKQMFAEVNIQQNNFTSQLRTITNEARRELTRKDEVINNQQNEEQKIKFAAEAQRDEQLIAMKHKINEDENEISRDRNDLKIVSQRNEEIQEQQRNDANMMQKQIAEVSATRKALADVKLSLADEENQLAIATAKEMKARKIAAASIKQLKVVKKSLVADATELNKSRVEMLSVKKSEVVSDSHAKELEQEVMEAKILLGKDNELLKKSRDRQQRLKIKINQKYSKLVHELAKAHHNEVHLKNENEELKEMLKKK